MGMIDAISDRDVPSPAPIGLDEPSPEADLAGLRRPRSEQLAGKAGLLPRQEIRKLVNRKYLRAGQDLEETQFQPASLDLRLGPRAYRVRASFLPGPARSVRDQLDVLALHEIDLNPGAVLETGCVYIAELGESLALPPDLSAATNPKSSTGRIDVFTRVIADRAREFDAAEAGYHGPLY